MKRWIDLPPIWLIITLVLAWAQARYANFGLTLDHPVVQMLGGILVGSGIIVMILAAIEFFKHKTTIIPHRDADQLITQGIFKRSRNPIYLGDAMILLGLILKWDAVLSLAFVPLFVWVIEKRFILPEEDRLRRKFRADYARYLQKTRRWL